jgi:eukaryotic-like serine/threonine-protein kinase
LQGDSLIGRQLANYKIEREIGHGGMAVVYFGWDINLNRPAAIKVLDARFRDQPNYTGRFLHEARMIASWRHEHILQIYYADNVSFPDLGKLFFFAMEYIDGQNLAEVLAQLVKQHGNVPSADVLKYGRAVAEALDYAHESGVIHRDVKPANILVSKDGRVVLSDFGLALEVQQGSIGEVFGSAHYIAPEQARRSSDAVPQSDLYSLGVILYEMLTGVVPFDDPSPTSVALQHITLPPPRPRDINPDLSEDVESVLLKALAKQPEDRYASGEDLIGALENALIRMHPSLPTHKIIPLPAAALKEMPAAPPTDPPHKNPLPVLSPFKGKFVFAAAGLAVIACLVLALSIGSWRFATANRLIITPSSAALLPIIKLTTPALSSASAEPATASTATDQPVTAPAQQSPAITDPPALASPNNSSQAAAQPTITRTPKYASGRKMILSWNDSSFYMLQLTGYGELIDPLVFERLNAEGVPSNRFGGKLWAELHSATLRDWCMRLEIGGPNQPADLPPFLRPIPCEEHYLATLWPAASDPTNFWTHQEGSRQFRVLWGREEIQRCEIDAGTCEVYLP